MLAHQLKWEKGRGQRRTENLAKHSEETESERSWETREHKMTQTPEKRIAAEELGPLSNGRHLFFSHQYLTRPQEGWDSLIPAAALWSQRQSSIHDYLKYTFFSCSPTAWFDKMEFSFMMKRSKDYKEKLPMDATTFDVEIFNIRTRRRSVLLSWRHTPSNIKKI